MWCLRVYVLVFAICLPTVVSAEPLEHPQAWLRDIAPLRRACEGGALWACDEIGRAARPRVAEGGAQRRVAVNVVTAACRAGSSETCRWMVRASSQEQLSRLVRRQLSAHACRAGHEDGCAVAGGLAGSRRKIFGSVLLPLGIALSAGGAIWLHASGPSRGLDGFAEGVIGPMMSNYMLIGGHVLSAAGHKLYIDGRRLEAGPGSRAGADVIGYVNMVAATIGALAPLIILTSDLEDRHGLAVAAGYASTAVQGVLGVAAATMSVGSGRELVIEAAPLALRTRGGVAPAVGLQLAF